MSLVARISVAALLICVAAFCTFGLLATYEPTTQNFLPWRIAYGLAITASLIAAAWIVWRGGRRRG